MDLEYWRHRWVEGWTGFHRAEVNPNLQAHWHRLAPRHGDRVLVPLCGKSVDIPWLAGQGVEPVGVEASELAVEALFADQNVDPVRERRGPLDIWRGGGMSVYVGDYFDLTPAELGRVAAAWDRAALIALPSNARPPYAAHQARLLSAGARLLMVTMAYADDGVEGPPYSVAPDEVSRVYGEWFAIDLLDRDGEVAAPGPVSEQGVDVIEESVWLLTRNEVSA